jgi:hypothetical protein
MAHKSRPCKTPSCHNTTRKFLRCADCRRRLRQWRDASRARAANRPWLKRYLARKKRSSAAVNRAWIVRNAARREAHRALQKALRHREITRPDRCCDCKKRKRPLVAWGVKLRPLRVAAFLCWRCYWARRNED